MLTGRSFIGIKRMGEIDDKAIRKALKRKFPKRDVNIQAAEISSKWQAELNCPEWHPFKIVTVSNKAQVIYFFLRKRQQAQLHYQ